MPIPTVRIPTVRSVAPDQQGEIPAAPRQKQAAWGSATCARPLQYVTRRRAR